MNSELFSRRAIVASTIVHSINSLDCDEVEVDFRFGAELDTEIYTEIKLSIQCEGRYKSVVNMDQPGYCTHCSTTHSWDMIKLTFHRK